MFWIDRGDDGIDCGFARLTDDDEQSTESNHHSVHCRMTVALAIE